MTSRSGGGGRGVKNCLNLRDVTYGRPPSFLQKKVFSHLKLKRYVCRKNILQNVVLCNCLCDEYKVSVFVAEIFEHGLDNPELKCNVEGGWEDFPVWALQVYPTHPNLNGINKFIINHSIVLYKKSNLKMKFDFAFLQQWKNINGTYFFTTIYRNESNFILSVTILD